MTLFSAIAEALSKSANRACVTAVNGRVFSRGDVLADAQRVAAVLAARGVGPGSRVLVKCRKSPDLLSLYLATLSLGAIFVPVSAEQTPDETAYSIKDAAPQLMVCEAGELTALSQLAARSGGIDIVAVDALRQLLASPITPPDIAGDAPAAMLYTSGTTGRPKAAVLSHDNLLHNAQALISAWGISDKDRLLHVLPMHHTHGLFVALNPLLLAGSEIILQDRFSAGEALRALRGCNLFMGVPTHYARLLKQPQLERGKLGHIRLFISGSAPLPKPLSDAFFAQTGHRVLERYGMTETGMLASNLLHGERKAGAVGRPLSGVDIRIQGDRDEGIGELEVAGRNVFSGYWRKPEASRAAFTADGYFKTGDLGYFDADGFIHLAARRSDLIISGGLNVYPAEVEEAILQMPGVADVAVIGVPHPDFGEAVVAVVVRGLAGSLLAEQLLTLVKSHLKDKISGYKHPKYVAELTALPRNRMGKIEKQWLRQRFAGLFVANSLKL